MSTDARPRYRYTLPDGTVIRVIYDRDEEPRESITFTNGGRTYEVKLLSRRPVYL